MSDWSILRKIRFVEQAVMVLLESAGWISHFVRAVFHVAQNRFFL